MTVPGLQVSRSTFTPLADSEEIVAFWDAGPGLSQVLDCRQAILWLQLLQPMNGFFCTLQGEGA